MIRSHFFRKAAIKCSLSNNILTDTIVKAMPHNPPVSHIDFIGFVVFQPARRSIIRKRMLGQNGDN